MCDPKDKTVQRQRPINKPEEMKRDKKKKRKIEKFKNQERKKNKNT